MTAQFRSASHALARARLVVLLAFSLASFATIGSRDAGATHTAFTQPLKIPPVLTGADIDLQMRQTPVQVLPGPKTTMWTYGYVDGNGQYQGTFPGPTIRRRAGEQTRLTFTNELPATAGSMTVHLHGEHATSANDGQPEDTPADPSQPCVQLLIPPGCSHTYTYDLTENGGPERPAMQWYHDHRMDVTGRNVWMGLAGMFIIDPAADDPLAAEVEAKLPSGAYDVPIMIADRSFDADNQMNYEFMFDGTFGDHVLMNGVPQPYFDVDTHKYRIRLLNASNTRPYELTLSNGDSFTMIGTESGLLPAPSAPLTHVRIGPAERVELILDFNDMAGQSVVLRDTLAFGSQRDLMEFRVRPEAVPDDSTVPATLRPLPETWDDVAVVTRTWILGQIPVPDNPVWVINGRGFSHHRVDTAPLNPKLGTTERWVFVNATAVDHLVHIHDVDWRIETRINIPPDEGANVDLDMLKETFRVRPNEIVTVKATFTDHVGRYVFHCHILEHEDRSMMAQFEVVP